MSRVHPHEGRAELRGEVRGIIGLEKPGEHRPELRVHMLATAIVTHPSEIERNPEPDQGEDHRRAHDQYPERQLERNGAR